MTAEPIQIAVVNYRFPVTTQTFHHRRHRHLADIGALHSVNYVRRTNGALPADCVGVDDWSRPIRRRDLLGVLSELREPSLVRMVASLVRRARRNNGEGGRLGALWQAGHGIALGRRLRESTATHVHGCFATAPATIALVAGHVAHLPTSFEVHTPQTAAVNRTLLATKLRRVDRVVVIADYTARLVRSIHEEAEPVIVHCGLDLEDDRPVAVAVREPSSVVAVGSLVPKKGHEILIRAAASLRSELPELTVTIAGAGPEAAALRRLIDELDAPVTLAGGLTPEEVARLRRSCNLGVLASVRTEDGDEDGIPVALMEFMGDGLPVVASDIAGIRELLGDGSVGVLVEPNDVAALAAAMRELLTDPVRAARLGAEGFEQVRRHFDNRRETERLVAALLG